MITGKTHNANVQLDFITNAKSFFELVKFRLSFLVVFSGAIGYLLGSPTSLDWNTFMLFLSGSFLVTGAANTINQIIEIESDKLMKRTAQRPLPTGRLSTKQAGIFALTIGSIGVFLLINFVSVGAGLLTLLSLVLYAFVYTPLKKKGPIAVLVGAFPGALPPLIGWYAITGELGFEAFILFGIQFIWQFPHFWAIAWVADEDYKRAGFKLLPYGGGQDLNTAFQIMMYTLVLVPLGLLPAKFGLTGINSAIVATVCGVLFLIQTLYLMKECTRKAAMQMMFGSFFYLPIVQISYLIDKV